MKLNRKKTYILSKYLMLSALGLLFTSGLLYVINLIFIINEWSQSIYFALAISLLISPFFISLKLTKLYYPLVLILSLDRNGERVELHKIKKFSKEKFFLFYRRRYYDLSTFDEYQSVLEVLEKEQFKPLPIEGQFSQELRKYEGYHVSKIFRVNMFSSTFVLALSFLVLFFFGDIMGRWIIIPIVISGYITANLMFFSSVRSLFGFRIHDDSISVYGLFGKNTFPITDIFYYDENGTRNNVFKYSKAGTATQLQVKDRFGRKLFHFNAGYIEPKLESLFRSYCYCFPRESSFEDLEFNYGGERSELS